MINEIEIFKYKRFIITETKDGGYCLYIDGLLVCVVDNLEELFKGNYYST